MRDLHTRRRRYDNDHPPDNSLTVSRSRQQPIDFALLTSHCDLETSVTASGGGRKERKTTSAPRCPQSPGVAKQERWAAAHLLGSAVRYRKAVEITKPEADFIIATGTATLSDIVVVSQVGKFYDVRALSRFELDGFLMDLARPEYALEVGVLH